MPTIQDQIDAIQQQIDAIKGDGTNGVVPAECSPGIPSNIAGLNQLIEGFKEQIRLLRISQIEEIEPFFGTTLSLKLDNKYVPSLIGANPAAVALINAAGIKPPVVVVDDVTIAAAGNNITLSVSPSAGVDPLTTLIAFVKSRDITVDVTQTQKAKIENVKKVEQALDDIRHQAGAIGAFVDQNVQLAPFPPSIGVPNVIENGLHVDIGVDISGSGDITLGTDWGDGGVPGSELLSNVSWPLGKTYSMEGEHAITITAANDVGIDEKIIIVDLSAITP